MTSYPGQLYATANKDELKKAYVGKKLSEIPTPAFLVKKKVVEANCDTMLTRAKRMNAPFRAHVKTHKTDEGVALQLGGYTTRVVVSTLLEAWKLLPYYQSGQIDDVLYGLPIVRSRVDEIVDLMGHVKQVRLMIDHASQLDLLLEYSKLHPGTKPWSFFIKVNMGTNRAGLETGSDELAQLIAKALSSPDLSLYGFYCHAGHSYASKSSAEALGYLVQEIEAANAAAKHAKTLKPSLELTISVGSTPTGHSAGAEALPKLPAEMFGELEIHAGNYLFCDLQQLATNCIKAEDVACSVLAEVASCYGNRGSEKPGEVLINAGVIALARELGPVPGLGAVITPGYEDWYVGRLSQEHGILVPKQGTSPEFPAVGTQLEIMPQHSCITANAFQWFYIVDGDEVVDVWTTWRGW